MGRIQGPIEVVGVVPGAFYFGFNLQRPDREPSYVLLPDQPRQALVDNDGEVPTTFYILSFADIVSGQEIVDVRAAAGQTTGDP